VRRAVAAALLYFAGAFLLGALLGAVRILALAPRLGETTAVLLELPLMLGACWALAGGIARRCRLGAAPGPRLLMGSLALLLLLAAEVALGALVLGKPLARILADWQATPGLIGLAGQVLFALLPVLHRRFSSLFPIEGRRR
jgi:hypothetical protein